MSVNYAIFLPFLSTLVSDNSGGFTAEDLQIFQKGNNIKHVLAAPGHTATNGKLKTLLKLSK